MPRDPHGLALAGALDAHAARAGGRLLLLGLRIFYFFLERWRATIAGVTHTLRRNAALPRKLRPSRFDEGNNC